MKKCKKCGIEKELTEFYKEKTTRDGFQTSCKMCHAEKEKEYYKNNKEQIAKRKKEYYKRNKERLLERQREYNKNNEEQKKECDKKYYENNKEKIMEYKKGYQRKRCQNDPVFRMIKNYRSRTSKAYSNETKSKSTMELLGCTGPELKEHLEKQFQPGMTHENYGEWHIDHIRPCASFDLSDPKQEQACFHYTNLQPLWAQHNLSKGAKH